MSWKEDGLGWDKIDEIFLIAIGIFLVIDALFIHGLSYDYTKIGLESLDPYISHAYFGVAFIIIGILDWIGEI